MEILSKRLRLLRKERGMRQEDTAAAALGLSTNGYQRYELNVRDPDAPVIVAMAELFGVSTDYLLGRSDER